MPSPSEHSAGIKSEPGALTKRSASYNPCAMLFLNLVMTQSKLPVVAVITNFNMADQLEVLLPQILTQGYDVIYVLDDASTDASKTIVESYAGVTFVAGQTNLGAGGNRNRILSILNEPAIIHFLDADVKLEATNTAGLVRQVVPEGEFGFVVGLANSPSGLQNSWNYGPRVGLKSDIGSLIQASILEPNFTTHPQRAKKLRRTFKSLVRDWPDPLVTPTRRKVYWGIEQNIIFRSDIFKRFGGFDESLRETEILELAIRLHRAGLDSYFDPRVAITHTEGDVRKYNRNKVKGRELLRISRKYGLRNWLVSADRF